MLQAAGSVFTNKYSEGYPGRRYYEGQQVVDVLEPLAIARAKQIFGVEHAIASGRHIDSLLALVATGVALDLLVKRLRGLQHGPGNVVLGRDQADRGRLPLELGGYEAPRPAQPPRGSDRF